MSNSQRAHAFDEFLQKLVGVHEHREMTTMDWHKLLAGCFHGLDVMPGKGGRSGEILVALKNKHRDGKLGSAITDSACIMLRLNCCEMAMFQQLGWPSAVQSGLRYCHSLTSAAGVLSVMAWFRQLSNRGRNLQHFGRLPFSPGEYDLGSQSGAARQRWYPANWETTYL